MLYLVKLEDLEQRYTKDFHRLMVEECEKRKVPYTTIEGVPLTGEIQTGAFLDANSTIHYKSTQIADIAKLFQEGAIKNGDTFFLYDLWMPGADAIRYMELLNGLQVNIYGLYFAGSWCDHDYIVPLGPFAQHAERGWASMCDGVFVGSQFLKAEFITRRGMDANGEFIINPQSVIVTGHPFEKEAVKEAALANFNGQFPPRDIDLIYPHRPHFEKGLDTFIIMANAVAEAFMGQKRIKAVCTSSGSTFVPDRAYIQSMLTLRHPNLDLEIITNLKKSEFFGYALRSRIVWSSALQENYGFSVQECATCGCVPVVPNRYAYPEFYPDSNLYDELDEGIAKTIAVLAAEADPELPRCMHIDEIQPNGAIKIMDAMGFVVTEGRTKTRDVLAFQ